MSRTRERKPKRGEIATTKIRSLEETEEWIRTAYAHSLTASGVSARRHARWLSVNKDTTAAWKAGETPVTVAQVLREDDVANEFIRCLNILVRAARYRARRRK